MYTIEPYLIFDGNCEEAFNYYKSVFGGQFVGIMKYRDIPGDTSGIPDSLKDKVVHVALPVGKDILLMGSDAGPGADKTVFGNNVRLVLSMEDEKEIRRLYEELSKEGKVSLPLQKTFFAELHAMLTDKLGINWMFNYGFRK